MDGQVSKFDPTWNNFFEESVGLAVARVTSGTLVVEDVTEDRHFVASGTLVTEPIHTYVLSQDK